MSGLFWSKILDISLAFCMHYPATSLPLLCRVRNPTQIEYANVFSLKAIIQSPIVEIVLIAKSFSTMCSGESRQWPVKCLNTLKARFW